MADLICTAFILMRMKSQDISSWSLKSPGTWEIELAIFFCILTLLTSQHPKSNDQFATRLLFMPEVTHGEFLKWYANSGLKALSQGSDSGGPGWFNSCPALFCKTKTQKELQLLPRYRCGFFSVRTILVWACTLPVSFLADSLAV